MSQITTHVLDTSSGRPAEGVPVVLSRLEDDAVEELARGVTDGDGRVTDLLDDDRVLAAGTCRLRFEVGGYLRSQDRGHFYPWVDVVFNVEGGGAHYHVPLLLSPHGYSTYRGS